MRIAVVSDVHHDRRRFEKLLTVINCCNYFVFCGDGISNIEYMRYAITVPQVCVKGNCDGETGCFDTASVLFGDTKAIVTHGHRCGAKQSLSGLVDLAKSRDCKLVLFGHTHKPTDKTVSGVRLINPGALMNGSYALVDIFGGQIRCEHGVMD